MFAFFLSSFPTTHYKLILSCCTSQKHINSFLRKGTSILALIQKAKCCTDQLRTTSFCCSHIYLNILLFSQINTQGKIIIWGNNSQNLLSFECGFSLGQFGKNCFAALLIMENIQLSRITLVFHF